MTDAPLIEHVARAWASMDGKDFDDSEYTEVYLSDADELWRRSVVTHDTRVDLTAPRVKPLVWVPSKLFKAFSSGPYVVQHEHDEYGGGVWVTGIDGEIIAERETPDDAKAAAQAHHEARVMACLE